MGALQIIKSPIGYLSLKATKLGLRSVQLHPENISVKTDTSNQYTNQASKEILEYFDGKRKVFSVDLDWSGYSDFYISVWSYLMEIPIGQTRSYGEIAKFLKNPGASRAVGLANGKNPMPVIVPCHRVIGSNGALTGFASGLHIKKQLLAFENPNSFAVQGNLF